MMGKWVGGKSFSAAGFDVEVSFEPFTPFEDRAFAAMEARQVHRHPSPPAMLQGYEPAIELINAAIRKAL